MPLPGLWEKNCPIKAGYFSRIIIINLSGGLKSSLDAEYRLVECVIHWRGGAPTSYLGSYGLHHNSFRPTHHEQV